MKTISLLLFTLLFSKGCVSEMKDTVVEYTANTRGFYMKINIQNQIATVSNDRNGVEKPTVIKIDDADWKNLVAEFQKIELDKLETYKDPTQKRFYDGAAIADLKIDYNGKTYNSMHFDHGYPPIEIEKFVKLVVNLSAPK